MAFRDGLTRTIADLVRYSRTPVTGEWHPDGTGVQPGGDDTGDNQVGDSWSVRFVNDAKPGSVITVTFYGLHDDGNPGEFGVERQVEWMVCEDPSDPGGTELWSDVKFDDMTMTVIDTAEDAEREARELAGQALELADIYGGWDGEPWAA